MRQTILIPALVLAVTCGAYAQGGPAPTRVGVINIQDAIASTKDGQKAGAELNTKFAPARARLEKKQAEIEADKAKLSQGSNAMSTEVKEKLMRDIDQKTKSLNRDAEDAEAEVQQETGKIMQELGGRIMAVIQKYAKDKGYALVLDVSSQQSPVLWAPDDITDDIIKLYDQNSPATVSGGAAAPAAPKPNTPAASTPPRPASTPVRVPATTPPATKK